MLSERVTIEVSPQPAAGEPSQIAVSASFSMRNQGNSEERLQVIFPITRLNAWTTEEALYHVDMSSFSIRVGGQPVAVEEITTPPELQGYDIDHGFVPDVRWAAFEVTFPARQDVRIQIDYHMLNAYGLDGSPVSGFTGVAYILETGAGWYGKIGSADIRVRLPYPVSSEAIQTANPGYIIEGDELRWALKDFEPSRKDNLELHVINSAAWQRILKLRARVEQQPADAQAWAALADDYAGLGLPRAAGTITRVDPLFFELALQARERVIDLRPGWGEAHFKLAELLWYGNPQVLGWIGRSMGASTPPAESALHLDDPSIRRVVEELELAWSLGSTSTIPELHRAFPELTPPPASTPHVPPPTAVSTGSSELVALSSPTAGGEDASLPITSEVIAAAVISIAIAIGTLLYLYKSRPHLG
jgi:hypothetical protein